MPSFNKVQRQRRAALAERKRAIHGDPVTGKLKQKSQPLSISGKRKRKLFKKWRRVSFLLLHLLPVLTIPVQFDELVLSCTVWNNNSIYVHDTLFLKLDYGLCLIMKHQTCNCYSSKS